jgi:hypothetical protein
MDTRLIYLQWAILGITNADVAQLLGYPNEASATDLIVDEGWRRWFPPLDYESEEQYSEASELRLKVFTAAKELYLASKYADLESAVLDSASKVAADPKLAPKDLKQLSGLFSELRRHSLSDALTKAKGSLEDAGVPKVIIRDLSGMDSANSAHPVQ